MNNERRELLARLPRLPANRPAAPVSAALRRHRGAMKFFEIAPIAGDASRRQANSRLRIGTEHNQ